MKIKAAKALAIAMLMTAGLVLGGLAAPAEA